MRIFIQRTLWLLIWAATMSLALLVSWNMAKDQPILLYVIVLAMVVMSVGYVYARQHWHDGNRVSSAAAFWVGMGAMAIVIVADVSYWSSSIEGIHDQIVREKAQMAGQDLVKERRRKQLIASTANKLPAQIRAEMATAPNNAELRTLRAQLLAAEELEKLQGQVLADSTQTVQFSLKRSFYEAARLGSENIGGTVPSWIFGITVLLVVFLLSLHALSLFIGFAPKAREARGAAKAVPAPSVSPTVFVAPQPVPEALERPVEAEPVKSPQPEAPKPQEYPRLVTSDFKKKPKTRAERIASVDSLTKRWLEATKPTKVNLANGDLGKIVYEDYVLFCEGAKIAAVDNSHFGRSIRRLGIAAGKTANGAVYGLKISRVRAAVA